MKTTKTRTCKTMFGPSLVLTAGLGLMVFLAVPAAAQYQIYDLNVAGRTQDIQTDNTNAVHLIWTDRDGGSLYYSRIVNNAIASREQIGKGISTVNWVPFISVRPDGSSVHVAWTTRDFGNSLLHSWRDGTGWHTETVMSVPSTQWLNQADCVVDSSGVVHVMFVIWNHDSTDDWATVFYRRKLATGNWESVQQVAPNKPESQHPMLFTDAQGNVHATWNSSDAYYCTAPSGGTLMGAMTYKIPKGPNINVNSYGDIYVDHNGVVHRSILSWSNSLKKMAIDYSNKLPGGQFSVPTRASLDFFSGLKVERDPVPAVVADETGRVIVAWGQIMATGTNMVKASLYDPKTRGWSIYTIDPAAGVPDSANSYKVALTRNDANLYGVWRASNGRLKLFVLPIGPTLDLEVTSPNSGEKWRAGSTQNITWGQNGLTGNVTIELYKNEKKTAAVGTAAAAAGTFEWSIPSGTMEGTDYKVRVYQGSVEDFSNANFQIVAASTPEIAVAPDSLVFGALSSGAKTQDQKVFLSNISGGKHNWRATASNSWITVSPKTGTGDAFLTIGVSPTGLGVGAYNGTVSVTDSNAANPLQTIAVKLNILQRSAHPSGFFDTPTNGSIVRGSISVSGWALDDIEIASVVICREPVKSDPDGAVGPDGLIYIGDTTFVEGARSDIETAYPGFPLNHRAGWGYMMLTYGLPGTGNGTFVLHAIAFDKEGNRADLGKRTIVADNAHNTKPFGTIDTPTPGGTVFGSRYTNFGWALTPPPKIIPTDGSTILVWIDGVQAGHPVYNHYREDIAGAYPSFLNTGGAAGYFFIDTTRYSNGVHTIGWTATDDAGAEGGMGSRFFTVFNSSQTAAQGLKTAGSLIIGLGQKACYRLTSELAGFPQDYKSPVFWRAGFSVKKDLKPLYPDVRGAIGIDIEEAERVEVHLGGSIPVILEVRRPSLSFGPQASTFEGYLVVGNELRPLPIGSTLDRETGVFSWQPGPGFLGQYDFVFIKQDPGRFSVKSPVTIRILPRGAPNPR